MTTLRPCPVTGTMSESPVLDKVVKTTTMPGTLTRAGTPTTIEFNTRGMMITTSTVAWYDINDSQFGGTRRIGVWPSGQANAFD